MPEPRSSRFASADGAEPARLASLHEAREAARASETRFRTLWDANVVGVAIADDDRILEANDAFLDLTGHLRGTLEAGEVLWRDMTPSEWRPADDRAMDELAARGRTATYEKEYARPDGRRVPVLLSGATLSLKPVRILVLVLDLSDRRAAEREREVLLARESAARMEAERALERIGRLQRITAGLSGAMSADEVSRLVLDAAVDALGAAGGVVALRDEGDLVLLRTEGYDTIATVEWERFAVDAPVPLAEAVRTGDAVLVEDDEERLRRYGALTRQESRHSALAAVPFLVEGRALGAMGLSFDGPRPFSEDDRALLMALGRQGGQALERARLYEERAYVARTLQEGLLPDRLADVAGLEVAVRYHSIADGGWVGGDFYDLFAVGEGHWLAAIGDVCGKGSEAAVLTGLARNTIRAIAMREPDPAEVLGFLNEALLRQLGEGAYCTVGLVALRRRPDGALEAEMVSGGHPYPILLRRGEGLREVELPGTLLGFVDDLGLRAERLVLKPGDLLVLYTDGVPDARGGGERFGDERLRGILEGIRDGSAERIADAVDDAVRRHQPGPARDDRALMVLRVAPA